MLTDAQVPDEKFLVLINDLLASGEIPDLFVDDELESVISGVRNEVKGLGMQDTRENCWRFFIDRVRRQLKVRSDFFSDSFRDDAFYRWFFVFRRSARRCVFEVASFPPSSIALASTGFTSGPKRLCNRSLSAFSATTNSFPYEKTLNSTVVV